MKGGGREEALKPKHYARWSNEVKYKKQPSTQCKACGAINILKYVGGGGGGGGSASVTEGGPTKKKKVSRYSLYVINIKFQVPSSSGQTDGWTDGWA